MKLLDELAQAGEQGARKWTKRELESLAGLKDSVYWPALQQALNLLREQDAIPVLDSRTDFAQTQWHRGRLSMIRDLVLLVTIEAPERLAEARKREADRDDDE